MGSKNKERIIKFIWNYYGEPAAKTAEHHSIHLKEFAEGRHLSRQKTGFEQIKENHFIAFILLTEDEAIALKDILRPNRAIIENP